MPTLNFLRKSPKFKPYVRQLERLILLRLLKQLASVYHTLRLDALLNLISGLDVSFYEVRRDTNKQKSEWGPQGKSSMAFGGDAPLCFDSLISVLCLCVIVWCCRWSSC